MSREAHKRLFDDLGRSAVLSEKFLSNLRMDVDGIELQAYERGFQAGKEAATPHENSLLIEPGQVWDYHGFAADHVVTVESVECRTDDNMRMDWHVKTKGGGEMLAGTFLSLYSRLT